MGNQAGLSPGLAAASILCIDRTFYAARQTPGRLPGAAGGARARRACAEVGLGGGVWTPSAEVDAAG